MYVCFYGLHLHWYKDTVYISMHIKHAHVLWCKHSHMHEYTVMKTQKNMHAYTAYAEYLRQHGTF